MASKKSFLLGRWGNGYILTTKSVTTTSLSFTNLQTLFFVVQFEDEDLTEAKRSLLAASPLGAGEVYAVVNNYSVDFDPCNQVDFLHLVTVNIAEGSWELLGLIKFIASIHWHIRQGHPGGGSKAHFADSGNHS